MPQSTWHNFILVAKRVLKAPLSLAVLFGGLFFALVEHGLTGGLIMAGAVAVVAVYLISKLHNESYIRDTIREYHDQHRRDDLQWRIFRIEELDVESRVKMKNIVKLQNEIAEDVENSPIDEISAGLASTVDETARLADRGLEIAQKHRELQRYLNKTDDTAIQARITALETEINNEQDHVRKTDLDKSLAAKKAELNDYRAIQQASARVLDQLDSIECSFASLRAKLVRIKSTDIAEWVAANEELKKELGGLNTSVETVEQSIDEVLTIGRI